MKFTEAFELLQKGSYGMRLPEWGKDVIIRLQRPDRHNINTDPYLYRKTPFSCVPWMPSVTELFSKNWEIIEGKYEVKQGIKDNE